jgi:hypothetical protein
MMKTRRSDEEERCMKQITYKMTVSMAVLVLLCTLVLPVFAGGTSEPASAPAATDWYAIQEGYDPTQTRAEFSNGRIVVNSVETEEKEPGSATLVYTKPVDLRDFTVSFSLDSYVPCADQYISIGFINKGTDLHYGPGASENPNFCMLLRPTQWPTVVDCAQGLLVNFDTDRNAVRVGKSNFVPGFFFETYATAPWSNVVFQVCDNGFGGFDVYINGRRINNVNDWWFINNIEDKTGSDDWYFYIKFKDGEYSPAQFTVKTLNGQTAVDPAVSGAVQNSLLAEGEKYAAVGGLLGGYVGVTKPTPTTTTQNPTTTTLGEVSTTKSTTASTAKKTTLSTTATTEEITTPTTVTTTVGSSDTSASSTTQSTTGSTQATQADTAPTSRDSSWLLWVGIGALVLAGVTVLVLVRRQAK